MKRLRIMHRDGASCVECGATDKTLNVHHTYYEKRKNPWDYPDDALLTLCEACHKTTGFLGLQIAKLAPLIREKQVLLRFFYAFYGGGPYDKDGPLVTLMGHVLSFVMEYEMMTHNEPVDDDLVDFLGKIEPVVDALIDARRHAKETMYRMRGEELE